MTDTLITLRNDQKAHLDVDTLASAIGIYKNTYVHVPALGMYVKATKSHLVSDLLARPGVESVFCHLRETSSSMFDLYID